MTSRRRPDDAEVIAAYIVEGLTIAEVGERFGYSSAWVLKRLKANDIPRRARGGGRVQSIDEEAEADQVAQVIALYVDEDLTVTEISRRTQQSRWWVRDRLVRHGVPIRSKRPGGVVDLELQERIRGLYVDDDLSVAAIAEDVSMSVSWVGRQLFEVLGVEPRSQRIDVDGELIAGLYVDHAESIRAIANRVGVSDQVVRRALTDRGIAIRSRGEANTAIDCDELRRLYVDEGREPAEIAELLGVSPSGVTSARLRCGIPTRPTPFLTAATAELRRHIANGLTNEQIAARYDVATWAVTRRLRAEKIHRPQPKPAYTRPSPPVDELRRLYGADQLGLAEVATHYGVPHATVRRWLDNAGIERRGDHTTTQAADDRLEMTKELLEQLYTEEELTAAEIGQRVGVSKKVVLKALHRHRIPVRPPGARRPAGEPLLDRLYDDPAVVSVLSAHGVAVNRRGGTLQERFPNRQPLTDGLVEQLYVGVGLSVGEISLVTGYGDLGVRAALQQAQIPARAHGRSPWTTRQ